MSDIAEKNSDYMRELCDMFAEAVLNKTSLEENLTRDICLSDDFKMKIDAYSAKLITESKWWGTAEVKKDGEVVIAPFCSGIEGDYDIEIPLDDCVDVLIGAEIWHEPKQQEYLKTLIKSFKRQISVCEEGLKEGVAHAATLEG